MTDFSAQQSAIGFFYQAVYGLRLLLDGDEEQELVLESLDDIVLELDGVPLSLFQTKHHMRRQARLTNASPDLWKTLRIWSTHVSNNRISFPPTRLMLVTTATAPEGSIAALLRPGSSRDCDSAREHLLKVAASSKSKDKKDGKDKKDKPLKVCFEAFEALSQNQQEALLGATYVIDQSPTISDTGVIIRKRIRGVGPREHREAIFERLQGWWFERVVEQLRASTPIPISGFDVYDKLAAIVEQFRPDALPIDFLDAQPDSVDPQGDNRLFVQQLRIIDLGKTRIEKAIIDYYRAFEQRSRWAREDLLVGGEVESYERRLVDEWERFAAAVTEELPKGPDEHYLKKVGRDIFKWMELKADIRIRPSVTEPYVMRGSYHMLANKPQPSVWWHPSFLQHLAAVVGLGKDS